MSLGCRESARRAGESHVVGSSHFVTLRFTSGNFGSSANTGITLVPNRHTLPLAWDETLLRNAPLNQKEMLGCSPPLPCCQSNQTYTEEQQGGGLRDTVVPDCINV